MGGCVKCPKDGNTRDTYTEDGYTFTMGEDGTWWSDDYFNDHGTTIGIGGDKSGFGVQDLYNYTTLSYSTTDLLVSTEQIAKVTNEQKDKFD